MVSTRMTSPSGVALAESNLLTELLQDAEHALGIDTTSATASSSLSSTAVSTTSSNSAVPSASSQELSSSTVAPSTISSSAASPTATVASGTSVDGSPEATIANGNNTQPHTVVAHFIVGNAYNYTLDTWSKDIALAASKGIDAFALNVGSDPWEPSQIANAYAAAGEYNSKHTNASTTSADLANITSGGPFKLFLSFDMSSFSCSKATDVQPLQTYIKTYANNTSQMTYNGRMFVSTFAGESCTFGATGSLDQAWANAVKPANSSLPGVWFMPSFFVDPKTFPNLTVIDGAFHWNSGWPMGNYNISFGPDTSYISNLGNRTYMAAVSPWFSTHYGKDTFNKNFIYRSDDWLFAQRWEMLVQNRTAVALTQVVTWNDYGESHYVGPIEGIQPMSQSWVNGFDHQGWLDLMQYYITAYKTGAYPAIAKDRVFLWGRLAPANASAPADRVGRPDHAEWAQDAAWAVALLTAPANVTISCGRAAVRTALVPAGLAKLKLPLPAAGCSVEAAVTRGAKTVLSFAPAGFTYNTRPAAYNFNAFVAASPA
ncbi:glycosyl hydrolase family 71-domain-containing protein [Trametes elegans]|nr:glycosyl hydrolase family 71-domain-containing protein [Trametes elegans]